MSTPKTQGQTERMLKALEAANAARDEVSYRARRLANACAVYVPKAITDAINPMPRAVDLAAELAPFTAAFIAAEKALDRAEREYRMFGR